MPVGRLGVWTGTDGLTAPQAAAFAQRVESWGYAALWIPEAVGREVFSTAAWLLANTRGLTVASGIANIYARDAVTAAAPQTGLNEQSGGRFLLGLGVSHIPRVRDLRQHERTIRARIEAHWQAGADHVCIQAIGREGSPDERLLALLAPGSA